MSNRAPRIAIAFAASVVLLTAFAGWALAADKFVTMHANKFLPRTVTINTGDKVTWVNDDDVAHNAVGDGWSTPILQQYDQDSVRFNRAGTYRYICSIHPSMTGTVVVRGGGGVTPDTTTEAVDAHGDGGLPVTLLAMLAAVTIGAAVVIDRRLRRRSIIRT